MIEQLATLLNERYVFPEKALEMGQAIRARAARGETSPEQAVSDAAAELIAMT